MISRVSLVFITIASIGGAAGRFHTNLVSVKSFGAVGDGVTDDTPAIQNAINSLSFLGGGTLQVPCGRYLLNSYSPSPHPWFFHNLLVPSNIMLSAYPGCTTFLQGPNGRAPIPAGATEVRNTVIAFGTPNYVVATFQNTSYNGGFYTLDATTAGQNTVQLANLSDASHFAPGDYVAIYSSTTGDVIPGETSQVISVAGAQLTLAHNLARSFAAPVIANVTALATINVGLQNLTVQGAEPLAATEVFGFTATNDIFTSDTSVGGGNTNGLNLNTLRGFTFTGSTVNSIGPFYPDIQLPQRNSQDGVFTNNSFAVSSVGFGEYGAHWQFTSNIFNVYPDGTEPAAVSIGGLDVSFSGNTITGITNQAPLLADYAGVDAYDSYVGQIRIQNNILNCTAWGSSCINLASVDPVASGNTITGGGNSTGILVQGPLPQSAMVTGNNIAIGSAIGVVIYTYGADATTVTCNTISGDGPYGVYIGSSSSAPNGGADTVAYNNVSGFTSPYYLDPLVIINYHASCQ